MWGQFEYFEFVFVSNQCVSQLQDGLVEPSVQNMMQQISLVVKKKEKKKVNTFFTHELSYVLHFAPQTTTIVTFHPLTTNFRHFTHLVKFLD